MSKTNTNEIWELDLPPAEKLVFLALYWRQGPTGCHPSIEELARMTGLSKSTVQRAIKNLKKRGLLDVARHRHSTNPRQQVNRYTLRPTATKDAGKTIRNLIGTQVNMTPVTQVTMTPNTGQMTPLTQVTMTTNRTTDRKTIGTAVKNDHSESKKSTGTMSRAEALATYGSKAKTGEPESGLAA